MNPSQPWPQRPRLAYHLLRWLRRRTEPSSSPATRPSGPGSTPKSASTTSAPRGRSRRLSASPRASGSPSRPSPYSLLQSVRAVSPDEPSGPDLDGVVADANAVGLAYVVIGGFSVIANGFLRATKDSDLLVPDGPNTDEAILRFLDRAEATRLRDGKTLTHDDVVGAHHLRVNSRHGIVDIMRGGLPPLDYDTVAKDAIDAEVGGQPAPVAGLRSIVGFKRLAGRPNDRRDLEELESLHGDLPEDPIPGLDDT